MKVFQISIEVNSGSVGRIAEQIGLKVLESDGESYITYARSNQPSQSQVIKIGNLYDVYYHVLSTRLFDNHCLASTKPTKELVRKMKAIDPDIIVIHHIHGYYLNMEVLFAYLSRLSIPIIWVFHDCWSFTGHCTHFEEIGCEKWKKECYECPLKTEYPASYLLDRSKRNFNLKKKLFNSVSNLTIVSVSQWMDNLVRQSFLSNQKMEVIKNGIDLNIFKPKNNTQIIKRQLSIENKFVILGVAAVWTKSKGLNDFLKLFNLIDEGIIIVLVGLSQDQVQNLPKGIIGIQKTENVEHLVDLYSLSDLYLNLTYNDTFPLTNLEALACGTPVLTYKTGGSVEAVSKETGFIIDQGDLNAVVEVVKKVREKGKEYYAENCRNRAISNFDKDDRYNDYIQLFKKLLKQ
ncbi:MAG TPA: glycosyltransferase [Edaphocola sp.]|nr:glycosyltransferase [Edaphocola sp.]